MGTETLYTYKTFFGLVHNLNMSLSVNVTCVVKHICTCDHVAIEHCASSEMTLLQPGLEEI